MVTLGGLVLICKADLFTLDVISPLHRQAPPMALVVCPLDLQSCQRDTLSPLPYSQQKLLGTFSDLPSSGCRPTRLPLQTDNLASHFLENMGEVRRAHPCLQQQAYPRIAAAGLSASGPLARGQSPVPTGLLRALSFKSTFPEVVKTSPRSCVHFTELA